MRCIWTTAKMRQTAFDAVGVVTTDSTRQGTVLGVFSRYGKILTVQFVIRDCYACNAIPENCCTAIDGFRVRSAFTLRLFCVFLRSLCVYCALIVRSLTFALVEMSYRVSDSRKL